MITTRCTLIALSFIITSCLSTKGLVQASKNRPAKFLLDNLNGSYKNKTNDLESEELWKILVDNYKFNRSAKSTTDNSVVKFEFLNSNKLKASLIENDSIIESLLFSGIVVGPYFSINKKLFLTPIPALYVHAERKMVVGNNENGDLLITQGLKNAAWVGILTSNFSIIKELKFERKN